MALKIVTSMTTPPRGMVREFKKARKQALDDAIGKWHADTLAGHFTRAAIKKYGYRERSWKYEARKGGKREPLVFSGDLQRNARAFAKITSFTDRALLRFGPGTQALNFSGRFNPDAKTEARQFYPDMREEIGATTPTEEREIARFVGERIAKILNERKPLKKVV